MVRILITVLLSANIMLAGLVACEGSPPSDSNLTTQTPAHRQGSPLSTNSPAHDPNLMGRWIIELKFDEGRSHKIQFDAESSGSGKFLLLDPTSSLNTVDQKPAEWSAVAKNASTEIHISGEIEFPLGNVGRMAGTLTLVGTLEQEDMISGTATFVDLTGPNQPTRKGSFVAKREMSGRAPMRRAPAVTLLSLNSGEVISRKKPASIKWMVQASEPVASQQIFLSIDQGQSFTAITPPLDGDQRSFVWSVSNTVGKTRKAMLKIVVTDEKGQQAEDVTDKPFRIK